MEGEEKEGREIMTAIGGKKRRGFSLTSTREGEFAYKGGRGTWQ